jgi:O-antigen ligase
MFKIFDLDKIYQYLLIILAFLMPITVFGANLVIVIISFLWLLSGNYKTKYLQITNSKLMIASILFFALHVIGLIWTEDINRGFQVVHKMWYFGLLFPILHSIVQEKNINYYLTAFLSAMTLSVLLSFSIWFEIIDITYFQSIYDGMFVFFKADNSLNPNVFMSHISYNPILTLAIYLVIHTILFKPKLGKVKIFFYSFVAIMMIINMFITGGRAGQVMFFAMLAILIFQYYPTQKFKSIFLIFIVISSVFLSAYHLSDKFHKRVNLVMYEIQNYDVDKNTSVGLRMTFAINSLEVISNNPLIGVGTGDFSSEYKKINLKNTPNLPNASNPHNMYILVLVQIGLLGLVSMLAIFYLQIKLSNNSPNKLIRDFGFTLPVLFLLIMLSDSYILGHFTTLVYIFFSSFLYKDFEKTKKNYNNYSTI